MSSRAELEHPDVQACVAILRRGSKSFAAASRLLPARIRARSAVVYAFCRVADDAVDLAPSDRRADAVARMQTRLDAIYRGSPADDVVDRALARVVEQAALPRFAFEHMLEGFAWDAQARRYESLDDLLGYCVRVASTVGALMTCLMMAETRTKSALWRASELGAAMQLTNIARDVGEDARAGRLYLPLAWLRDVDVDPEAFLRAPRARPEMAFLVARLLETADRYYASADEGITLLPRDCRVAISAARAIYSDIGRSIRRAQNDTVSRRAVTSRRRKLWLLARSARAFVFTPPRFADGVSVPRLPASVLVDEAMRA